MEIRKLNHPYTVRELEAAHNRGTPTTSLEICPSPLDPDGVARSGRPLHMDDRRAEQTLLRSVFDCVRRGQMDKALRLCRAAGQPWRAVTLAGGIYFDDPNLVAPGSEVAGDTSTTPWDDGNAPTGNRNRGRWLLTCFQIANEPTFEDFERAVYAALCGNTTNVLPVCQSWEDRLWAYYNSLVVRMTEEVCVCRDNVLLTSAHSTHLGSSFE